MTDFVPFAKIPRLYSQCRITEKIDGTNACVEVVGDEASGYSVAACSRTRRLMTAAPHAEWEQLDAKGRPVDNYGFGQWVANHAVALTALGPGRHFGEWWGSGIQRGYGFTGPHARRFSTFWGPGLPGLVGTVPVLYEGEFSSQAVIDCIGRLSAGSIAAPGFERPEGVVVTFAAGPSFKVVVNGDESKRAG